VGTLHEQQGRHFRRSSRRTAVWPWLGVPARIWCVASQLRLLHHWRAINTSFFQPTNSPPGFWHRYTDDHRVLCLIARRCSCPCCRRRSYTKHAWYDNSFCPHCHSSSGGMLPQRTRSPLPLTSTACTQAMLGRQRCSSTVGHWVSRWSPANPRAACRCSRRCYRKKLTGWSQSRSWILLPRVGANCQ